MAEKAHCVYQLRKLTLKKFVLFLSQKRPCAGMCFSCCQGTPLPSSTSRAHCRFCGQEWAGELQAGDGNVTTSKSIKLSTRLFINLQWLFSFSMYLLFQQYLFSPHTLWKHLQLFPQANYLQGISATAEASTLRLKLQPSFSGVVNLDLLPIPSHCPPCKFT